MIQYPSECLLFLIRNSAQYCWRYRGSSWDIKWPHRDSFPICKYFRFISRQTHFPHAFPHMFFLSASRSLSESPLLLKNSYSSYGHSPRFLKLSFDPYLMRWAPSQLRRRWMALVGGEIWREGLYEGEEKGVSACFWREGREMAGFLTLSS